MARDLTSTQDSTEISELKLKNHLSCCYMHYHLSGAFEVCFRVCFPVLNRDALSNSSDFFILQNKEKKINTTNAKRFGRGIESVWTMLNEIKICSHTFLYPEVCFRTIWRYDWVTDTCLFLSTTFYDARQKNFKRLYCFSCFLQVLLIEKQPPLMLCYLLNIVQKFSPVALAEEGREMQPAGWLLCRVKHCWNQQKGAKKSVWHPVKTKKLLLQEASWQGIRAHTLKQVASWAAECVNPLPVPLPPWVHWCLIKDGLMSTNENPLLCMAAYFHEIYRNTVALGLLPPHQRQVKLPSGFQAQRRNPWQIDW